MAVTEITGILVSAKPANAWIGACAPCGRGIRSAAGHGDRCTVTCPACGGDVTAERIYGTVTAETCDPRCMGATGPSCSCACGGENHGGAWQQEGEALASAIAAYSARAAKAALAAQRRADSARSAFGRWAEPHRDLIAAIIEHEYASDFLGDLASRLRDRRELTPNQLTAAARAVQSAAGRLARQAEQDAQRAEFAASGKTVPAGRITFTGEILSARYEESGFSRSGGAVKCLIVTGDGYRVWGTLPSGIFHEARNEAPAAKRDEYRNFLYGRQVEITATVSPKPGEAGFGFFSRPKGRLLAAA